MSAARSSDGPDPGSFGGHPYTPQERALGYGTDHDPRFTCSKPDAATSSWGRDDWSGATVEEMRERLYEIGPPWGNSKLLASKVIEGFWIAFEALHRLEPEVAD